MDAPLDGPPLGALALSGVRVLDLTSLLPGALCGRILADHGAEVIKVENPARPDPMRSRPPLRDGRSTLFELLGAGKRGIALDLKDSVDLVRFHALVRSADVVLEGFRPGVADRLQVSYERLREIRPNLVYCSLSSFGQSGPLARRPAFDVNMLALTGYLDQSGPADGPPTLPAAPLADAAGALDAVIRILAALLRRTANGTGERIDVSLAKSVFPLLHTARAESVGTGKVADRGTTAVTGGSPRYGVYRTADDRHVAVGLLQPAFWDAFRAAVGWTEPPAPEDERAALTELFGQRTAEDWATLLWERHDVPCTVVRTLDEAAADPAFRDAVDHWGTEHDDGAVVLGGSGRAGRAPALGADTEALLRDVERGEHVR